MSKFIEALGGWFDKGSSKNLTKPLLLATVGIALLLAGGLFSDTGSRQDTSPQTEITPQANTEEAGTMTISEAEKLLEERLRISLEKIQGVGSTSVTVSLASTNQQEFAVNTNSGSKVTNEKDPSGGTRVTTESTDNGQMVLVHQNQGSGENPVVVRELKPEIQGVIVVAEGADNPYVKAELVTAVQTLLDIPAHKVSVLPKESR